MEILQNLFNIILQLPQNIYSCYSIFTDTLDYINVTPLQMFGSMLGATLSALIVIHMVRLFV